MTRHPVLSLALAATLAAVPTAVSAAPAVRTVQTQAGAVQEVVLNNGLKVILKENHAAPVVTWAVGYKVGSRNEPVGATGSAHLLEHMLFKGTKTLGKGQIARLLERNGADYNAFTDFDLTASYAINDKVSITGSIMNLFDREPPFDPSNYAAVNYNPTYSQAGIVGRFYNLGVKFKL